MRPVEKLYTNRHCGSKSKPIPLVPDLGRTHALFSAPRACAATSSHTFSIPPSTALRMTTYTSFLVSLSFAQLDLRPMGISGHKLRCVTCFISVNLSPHPTRLVETQPWSFLGPASPLGSARVPGLGQSKGWESPGHWPLRCPSSQPHGPPGPRFCCLFAALGAPESHVQNAFCIRVAIPASIQVFTKRSRRPYSALRDQPV